MKIVFDYCEAAKFSCYISPNLTMYPCSFIQSNIYGGDLKTKTIKDVWCSEEFIKFNKRDDLLFEGKCPCDLNVVPKINYDIK